MGADFTRTPFPRETTHSERVNRLLNYKWSFLWFFPKILGRPSTAVENFPYFAPSGGVTPIVGNSRQRPSF